VERNEELERTVVFQKAKIEAMEFELETTVTALGEKEANLLDLQRDGKTSSDESKKQNK
jgi:hypothetical protein